MITETGLEEDIIVDTKRHGGAGQAVYLYNIEDYNWWSQELDRKLTVGSFGDNLTLSGLGDIIFQVGDRLEINNVLLEITFPRIPCSTLVARMNIPDFVTTFIAVKRPGIYARVLRSGYVLIGDRIYFLPSSRDYPTIIELYELWHAKKRDPSLLRKYLKSPIAERAKKAFQFWLENA